MEPLNLMLQAEFDKLSVKYKECAQEYLVFLDSLKQ
jgi:hypothetical protein